MRWLVLLIALLLPHNSYAAKKIVQPQDIDSITVLASTSMAAPLTELCKLYSLKTARDVNAVFDSSANNVANIEDGDPADIIITPSRKWFTALDKKGLVDPKTLMILAKNRLALVSSRFLEVRKDANARVALDNVYNKTLLVMADNESDALGEYSQQALISLGMWDKFAPRIIPAPTSANAVSLIIKGRSAGIVFASDAKLFSNDLNTVAIIPQNLHKKIEYLGAVVVGEDMVEAKDFLQFLASSEAKLVFEKYGFVIQ